MIKQKDAEAFVSIWMQAKLKGKGQEWVASRLGTSRQAVGFKLNRLRSKGVNLPNLKNAPTTSSLNIERLNEIVEKTNVSV